MTHAHSNPGFLGWDAGAWRHLSIWIALLVAVGGTIVATQGVSEDSFSLLARTMQRFAFVSFLGAFVAGPLHYFRPGVLSRWLVRRRPQLGVGFALAHWVFLATNIARVQLFYEGDFLAFRPWFTWVFGGMAEVLFAAMVVTSFPAPRRALGPRLWRALHTLGVYVIALTFAAGYVPRAVIEPRFLPFAVLLIAAFALRFARIASLCATPPPPRSSPSSQ